MSLPAQEHIPLNGQLSMPRDHGNPEKNFSPDWGRLGFPPQIVLPGFRIPLDGAPPISGSVLAAYYDSAASLK